MVAPGFIDVHTHVEGTVEKVPRGDNYVMDGVTTVVTGNCGGSEADLAAFFARLEKLGLGLNVASLVGHNTVRQQVMGTANRQATPEEIARMQELVENGMRDGAVGFSTGLIYIPGTYSQRRRGGGAGEGGRETRRRLRQPHARRGREDHGGHRRSRAGGARSRHAGAALALQDRQPSGCGA